jgi:hypothetical protein
MTDCSSGPFREAACGAAPTPDRQSDDVGFCCTTYPPNFNYLTRLYHGGVSTEERLLEEDEPEKPLRCPKKKNSVTSSFSRTRRGLRLRTKFTTSGMTWVDFYLLELMDRASPSSPLNPWLPFRRSVQSNRCSNAPFRGVLRARSRNSSN